jgi:hypothetical protein
VIWQCLGFTKLQDSSCGSLFSATFAFLSATSAVKGFFAEIKIKPYTAECAENSNQGRREIRPELISDGGLRFRQMRQSLVDFLFRMLIIRQLPGEILLVRGHIEMSVAAQIE